MPQILDVQKLRLIEQPEAPAPDAVLECDLLIAGGSLGGCAAALAACRAGRRVVLTEETDWLGGQITSQGVSALDESPSIETFGGTRSYYELRELIRQFYRERAPLSDAGRQAAAFNPGNGWVSHLCFEPRAGLWALEQLLHPFEVSGRLTVLFRYRAVSAEVADASVRSVLFRNLDGPEHVAVRAAFVLDATELGDLLPLTDTEYVTGAESRSDTGEPHALDGAARPGCVQSFTYPFVLEHRPGERHSIARPPGYALNAARQPYTLRHRYDDERGWVTYRMFAEAEGTPGPFWTYRRLIDARNFDDPRYARDLAMINWPGNDFRHGGIIDVPAAQALAALENARHLSLGFCYWLQNDCPRDDGGAGYGELLLRPDVMGTGDGLSRYPYIRESRRIRSVRPVLETDIAAEYQSGARARYVPDSVGVGFYPIDIHPTEGEEKVPPAHTRPFQLPLSALVPVRIKNLLPACKNIGTTHITNGAYRLHPTEWGIGEAAALLAVFCLDRSLSPQTVVEDGHRRRRFQRRLVRSGVPIHWFTDVPLAHPAFEAAQLVAGWGVWTGDAHALEARPEQAAGPADLRAFVEAPRWARERVERLLATWLPRWPDTDRATLLRAAYAVLSI